MDELLERRLTGAIIASFYRVYDELGFGLLESVYVSALLIELTARGIQAQREATIDVFYRGVEVGHFRADLLVDGKVIVEVKASLMVTAADRKQLLNYLRGTSRARASSPLRPRGVLSEADLHEQGSLETMREARTHRYPRESAPLSALVCADAVDRRH